jgi:hypothetical protein
MKEHTVQFDLIYLVKKLSLESGVKGIFRNNFSQFISTSFDSSTNKYLSDPVQTNDFKYQQNILSAYQSVQLSMAKWVAKAGLRFEHAGITPSLSTGSSAYSHSQYHNLLPSVAIQRNLSPVSSIVCHVLVVGT